MNQPLPVTVLAGLPGAGKTTLVSHLLSASADHAGSRIALPDEYAERGAMVVGGVVESGGAHHEDGAMIVFDAGEKAEVTAVGDARVMLLGGAALDGERHVWWNFVSSSRERIEQAKADWKGDRFARIPGETEFIPLPT